MTLQRAEKWAYYLAYAFVLYMPLHIFLSQSLSLITGGLDIWKAAKDIIMVLAVFPLLFIAYKQGALKDRFFKKFAALGAGYVLIYFLFLIFDKNADTTSAITGSVYNTRILGYFLLGYVVANARDGSRYVRSLLKALLVMCGIVAAFGVLQYFLPKDFLTHFGYSVDRGVKPMFFIDDKPDFPRVMSTLRDPNSLGAFLAFPIAYSVYFLFIKKGKQAYKVLSDNGLKALLFVSTVCLFLTFSRSGLITAVASTSALLLVTVKKKGALVKKLAPVATILLLVIASLLFVFRNTYTVQNVLLHADASTVQEDPNELRLSLGKKVADHIKDYPFGEGPGTAGLVSISNPKGTQLTENYYLQIAYEVGIFGFLLYVAIFALVLVHLFGAKNTLSTVVLATGLGIAVFSMLNHSWSNEGLALQWWLLAGMACVLLPENAKLSKKNKI
jgi:hypothetical protein